MSIEAFYPAKTKCPQCGRMFKALRPRSPALRVKKTDSDFCVHYHDEVDPLEQQIIVCPQCRYAADTASFERLPTRQKNVLKAAEIKAREMAGSVDLSGRRDESQVTLSYQLAQIWADTGKSNFHYRGSLNHHLAWYYRKHKNYKQERVELREAVKWLQHAYSEDSNLPKSLGPGGYEYIIGEILRRLYDFDGATLWLSRCLEAGGKSMLPRIRQLWEDAWEAVRQGQQPEEGEE